MISPPALIPPHLLPKYLLFFSTSSRLSGLSHDLDLALHSHRTLTPPQPHKSTYPSPLFIEARISPPLNGTRVMPRVN